MKRTTLFTMLLATGALTAHAADYAYLNIEKTDGTARSMTAIGLNITYSGTTLTATNGSETATFLLSEVSRMYFSNTEVETGINGVATSVDNQPQAGDGIYNLQGQRVADLSQRQSLSKGIYIIRENGQSKKIQIK